LLRDPKFEFDVERAIFVTVLHRLMTSGSGRYCDRRRWDDAVSGTDDIDLHHLYRAMAFLGEPLADKAGASEFAPRCNKDLIEEDLFRIRPDLKQMLWEWLSTMREGRYVVRYGPAAHRCQNPHHDYRTDGADVWGREIHARNPSYFPFFHQRDDTIRGHVFCSFLALVLRKELERHLKRPAMCSSGRHQTGFAGAEGDPHRRKERSTGHPQQDRGRMQQSVPCNRHGDAAHHPRNLIGDFCKAGMRVVPRKFLRSLTDWFHLLKISLPNRAVAQAVTRAKVSESKANAFAPVARCFGVSRVHSRHQVSGMNGARHTDALTIRLVGCEGSIP